MESSQVSTQKDVSYEDLVKQCPYLAQRSGLSLKPQLTEELQVSEVALSKSKKKRLKKRLKTLSLTCKSPVSEEGLSVVSKLKEQTTSINPPVSTILCEKSLKMEKPQKLEQMGTPNRIPDVVDGEILVSNSKVNREQVLHDRERRKKSKQQAKQAKKDGVIAVEPFCTDTSHSNECFKKCTEIKDDTNDLKIEANNKDVVKEVKLTDKRSKVKNDVTPAALEEGDAKSKYISKSDTSASSLNEGSGLTEKILNKAQSTEKTREEILAEREAKKKAKQMAKLKKSDKVIEQGAQTNVEVTLNDVNIAVPQLVDVKEENKLEVKSLLPDSIKASSGKSKAELRAERRAKQEAQRAAKEAEKKQKTEAIENKENKIVTPTVKKQQITEKEKEIKVPVKPKIVSQQRIKLFSHLPLGEKPAQTQIIQTVHPSIIELGVKYSARIINGSNARCVALLNCLKEVITDYTTPSEKEFSRGLESKLGELANYINQCRPMSVSMTNSLRHIKSHLTQLPNNVSDEEAKRKLFDVIDTFIREQIDVAGEAICESVKNKIANGDVILIYSCSSLLYRILAESHRSGREFRVVVVDGGPWFEGREMLRRLVSAGLKCTYVQVSAISFIMKQATKVLLGAHALLANGCVMSRAGASIVALSAHSYNVPVLVCCETYKFCERVQTDAFVYNELGSPDDLIKEDDRLANWQSLNFLSPLSLVYDITPPDLVTAVVTEIAILPCTSVPVILRVKPSDVVS